MQNDLISRSALLEGAMAERYEFLREKNGNYDHYTDGFEDAMLYVEDAPAVDAVPVVYCRECKHWRVGLDRTNTWCSLLNGMETVGPDYCSFGGRRADDGK